MNKETIKRYAISSAITFAASFAIVLYSEIDNITMESFRDGTVLGIVFLATRAAVKAVLEGAITIFRNYLGAK